MTNDSLTNDKINELSEDFIQKLISAGVCADESITNEAHKKREQEKAKTCYHCTKVLMEKYRKIVSSINFLSQAEFKVLPELKEQTAVIDRVLDYVDDEYLFRDKLIEARLNSLRISRNLIERVNIALTVMCNGCQDNSLYLAIYYRYIDTNALTEPEILRKLGIGRTLYRNQLKKGLEELSTLLWITDDFEVSLVLETLARINL